MNLSELIANHPHRPDTGVPDWLIGCFRRHLISFANGASDDTTRVFWLQSRNLTIDLRLPLNDPDIKQGQLHLAKADTLRELANVEGWIADSEFQDGIMDWHNFTRFQFHNRWQEPARLQRVGNCMIEWAPSGAYVEDWRQQPSYPGPLVGLRLLEARNQHGKLLSSGGGLIVCGDHAAWVQGRPTPEPHQQSNGLREAVAAAQGEESKLAELFCFETSVATGSLHQGYRILHSTLPWRSGSQLIDLDGFSSPDDSGRVTQTVTLGSEQITRMFSIDTLEPQLDYRSTSTCSDAASQWFEQEAETLTRYTRTLI